MKQIKKVFADGIELEDPQEEVQLRRAAYCLSLGITPEFLENHQRPLYVRLLDESAERSDIHKERMDDFKKKNGPKVRLPLDNCCEETTNMCKV